MNTSTLPLTGKIAIVTGGSRSIGAAIAKRLAADGANVAITYNASPDRAAAVVQEIVAAGGQAVALAADAGNPEAVRAAIAEVAQRFGKIDILVNNAGISLLGAPEDIAFEDFQRILAVNVTGVFVATQQALKHMGQGGRIIHIGSSMVQYAAFATASVYTLSKGALTGFSRGLVRDLGPRGITVNTVHPGPTDSDMNPANGPMADTMHSFMAIKRHARADEIAELAAYLAGPHGAMITGSMQTIDGGFGA